PRSDAERTAPGHADLLMSIGGLERALGSAAAGRAPAWARTMATATCHVHQMLIVHTISTDGDAGLLSELGRRMPWHRCQLDALKEGHVDLLDEAEALALTLEKIAEGRPRGVEGARRRAVMLIAAIRLHLAREADLLYEAFGGDLKRTDSRPRAA